MGIFAVVAIILALLLMASGLILVLIYNRLIGLKNRYKNAFSQIDVQLKRRYDLIPNLVESCQAYLTHERTTLEAVIAARNTAASARQETHGDPTKLSALKELTQADGLLTGALGKLSMVMESYPDLKASQTVASLMDELSSTENRVGFARQAYNDAIMEYNQSREMFPAILFVGLFGFFPAEHWFLEDKSQGQALKISIPTT